MSLCYGNAKGALENRKTFLKDLGIDYRDLVCAKQVHGSCVRYAKEEDKGKGALVYDTAIADTDALITDEKNLPLAIFTADCLPVFLYDPITPAIGLAHAGWRGTKENITAKTIKLMQQEFNTQIENIQLGFGPAIRDCCYELDLTGLNKKQALDLGVKEANISDCGICTSCRNTELFSYRKEKDTSGRMMSVIMLR